MEVEKQEPKPKSDLKDLYNNELSNAKSQEGKIRIFQTILDAGFEYPFLINKTIIANGFYFLGHQDESSIKIKEKSIYKLADIFVDMKNAKEICRIVKTL